MKKALEMALEALEKIAMVNAMDYEYQQWAKEYLAAIKEALAQPKRNPLTDEQISKLAVCGVFHGDAKAITRAIEAFHGIKE